MAILQGIVHKKDKYRISFSPVSPSIRGRRDAYMVHLKRNNSILLNRMFTCNYEEWPIGHWEIESTARILSQIRRLAGQRLPISVFDFPVQSRKSDFKKPSIFTGPDFFRILIWEAPGRVDDLFCLMFLLDHRLLGARSYNKNLFSFCGNTLICKGKDIERFGRKLLEEYKYAQVRRVKLGLGREDDPELDEL